MIDSPGRRLGIWKSGKKQYRPGDMRDITGRAMLIGDNPDFSLRSSQAKHGFDKIVRPAVARPGIQPAGPHDKMFFPFRGGEFAGKFGSGVNTLRRGRIVLAIGTIIRRMRDEG